MDNFDSGIVFKARGIYVAQTTQAWAMERRFQSNQEKEKENQHRAIQREFEPVWSHHAQESPWYMVGCTTYLAVGGLFCLKVMLF